MRSHGEEVCRAEGPGSTARCRTRARDEKFVSAFVGVRQPQSALGASPRVSSASEGEAASGVAVSSAAPGASVASAGSFSSRSCLICSKTSSRAWAR